MDNLKLLGKNKDHTDSLVKTVHLLSKETTMEFDLKTCGILILKRGKIYHCEGITFLNRQIMRKVENYGYKCFGMVVQNRMG